MERENIFLFRNIQYIDIDRSRRGEIYLSVGSYNAYIWVQVDSMDGSALFGCCRIHFNPCVLVWNLV